MESVEKRSWQKYLLVEELITCDISQGHLAFTCNSVLLAGTASLQRANTFHHRDTSYLSVLSPTQSIYFARSLTFIRTQ